MSSGPFISEDGMDNKIWVVLGISGDNYHVPWKMFYTLDGAKRYVEEKLFSGPVDYVSGSAGSVSWDCIGKSIYCTVQQFYIEQWEINP